MHQAAAPFVSLPRAPHKYPSKSMETFYTLATSIGFTPSKDNLHSIHLEDARLMNALPRTRKEVHNNGTRLLNKVSSREGFDTRTFHVQNCTRAWVLQFYASQPGLRDPQTPEVWEEWANVQLPPRLKDFAQRVFWHKLTVHERIYKRWGTDKCPICALMESIKPAMVECSMSKAAAAVIESPVATGDGGFSARDMMESDHQEWLLSTNQGGAMWSARSAHWRYRCEVKAGVSPVFTSYLTTWLRELSKLIEYYSRERKAQWRGFKQSLEQLGGTRLQPRQGGVRINKGLSAWRQTHTACFTQERNVNTRK